MSGHGGFSAIGSGMQVPQPLAMPNVEELQPGKDKRGALNVEGHKAEVQIADTRLDQTNRLAANLDAMLLRAAKTASAPVDVKALKDTLVAAGLDKATRKAIEGAAKKAQTSFQAINQFSGRQIAEALTKDEKGHFDWNEASPVGKAIKAALDAQADLSELLYTAQDSLPPNASARARDAVMEAMFQTDRRASELQTLVCDFADMAEKAGNDPAINARLDKTLESLIPSQSLKMHGSEKIAADFRTTLMPLAKRIDDLAAAKERQLSDGEATKIRRQIDEAFNALAKAETTYAAKGMPLDHSLFESARGMLTDLTKRLNGIRREVAMASMRTFIDKTFTAPDLPILQDKFKPLVKKLFPALVSAIDTQRLLRKAALEFLEKHNDATVRKMNTLARELASLSSAVENELKSIEKQEYKDQPIFNFAYEKHEAVQNLVNSLSRKDRNACTPEFVKEFCQAMMSFVADNVEAEFGALKVAYGGIFGASTQTAHLVQMFRNAADHDSSKFLTNKTLAAVFEGRAAVTTVVETRLAGLPDEDADPALDSTNAVSSKPLGSGQVNTVYQVGYKDGSTYIFKPEAPGRQGLEGLQLSKGSYKDTQLVAQLNMSAQKTADAFGLGDVMTKTSVGAHDGQFGLFMEKALGCEAANYGRDNPRTEPGCLNAQQIKELPDAQYGKVVGELMRKTNRLEWFDILTGQGDRHHHNYMVNVPEAGDVTVKAIDNDACFGTFIIAPGVFVLRGEHAAKFAQAVNTVGRKLYPSEVTGRQIGRLNHDPGIRQLANGAIVVDTSKMRAPELHFCLKTATGCHVTRAPDYIDEELYDKLVAMKGGEAREKYIADLKARLTQDQVDVAINRLDAAIAHAEKLKEDGRVVSTDDWGKKDVQRMVAGPKPKPLPAVGGRSPNDTIFAKNVQADVNDLQGSLFRRDLLPHIAKPGWFEE